MPRARTLLTVLCTAAVALAGCHESQDVPVGGADAADETLPLTRPGDTTGRPIRLQPSSTGDYGNGCNTTEPGTADDRGFRTIAIGWLSALNATQALVGDDGPFQDLWRRHLGVSSMTCDEPVVDFGSEQVAILVLGGRAPCQGVQVLDVEGAEGSVRVEFVETMPAAGSVCIFENGTTPFHFVAVSRNAIGATFTEIYRTLAKGQDTHLPARQSVFETQEAWRTLWTEHKGNASAEPPAVDFETERVAVVAIGMRPNGCYGVWISDVDRLAEGAMTILEVKETGPREGFLCSQVIVEPYHFIAIPKDGTTVSFSG